MKKISLLLASVAVVFLSSCGGPAPAPAPEAASRVLVLVDMQNDFIDGTLGSADAQTIVPAVVEKVRSYDGYIVATRDTHGPDYLTATLEGKLLPVAHCLEGSAGWEICKPVTEALEGKVYLGPVNKVTFGSVDLPGVIAATPGFDKSFEIEVVGLDTDICVVSNALSLRMHFPDNVIRVDASCCAGTSPERHRAALETMKSCQIEVVE